MNWSDDGRGARLRVVPRRGGGESAGPAAERKISVYRDGQVYLPRGALEALGHPRAVRLTAVRGCPDLLRVSAAEVGRGGARRLLAKSQGLGARFSVPSDLRYLIGGSSGGRFPFVGFGGGAIGVVVGGLSARRREAKRSGRVVAWGKP